MAHSFPTPRSSDLRHVVVEVEGGAEGPDPGKAPAHAPLEGGNPLVGRARDGDERKVRVLEVLARRIDMVGLEGAAGATLLPVRAEHEVLHDELAAPGEAIAQRDRPVRP